MESEGRLMRRRPGPEDSLVAFVEINPRYREMLRQQGLLCPRDFFALPNVIVSGHPDRHVARVALGSSANPMIGYLKREHRVLLKDRLLNICAGHGFVSKSRREAQTLQSVASMGIGCPEWMAFGEDDAGRAFLLVRELSDTVDLRDYLRGLRAGRSRFLQRLGVTIARIHEAGFDQPDLYSKHILIGRNGSIHFLDWQRSRRGRLGWRQRWRDLAALSATLSDDLLRQSERLLCLRAYLRSWRRQSAATPPALLRAAFSVWKCQKALLGRRRIREMRQLPIAGSQHQLVWVDGEALCTTRAFQEELQGQFPDWLRLANLPAKARHLQEIKHLPLGGRAFLQRRRASHGPIGFLRRLIKRAPVAPEVRQAALIFRLQRHGVATPKLLAFGQRSASSWQTESFVAWELPAEATEIGEWLREVPPTVMGGTLRERRRQVIHEAGLTIRRLHDATVNFDRGRLVAGGDSTGDQPGCLFVLEENGGIGVVCGAIAALVVRRRRMERHALADLILLRTRFAESLASRADELRFLLSYLGVNRLTPAARTLARAIIKATGRMQSTRSNFEATAPARRRAA
jgi:tRNA A-37 threonylcarbamoyl transferase component Bud32